MMQKLKRNLSRIFGGILNILLILVSIFIIVGIYYIIQIKVLNNNYANLFGYTFFEVATGSMSPTINVGDIVVVKLTKEVSENDIIVYNEDDNFITHRLIQKENNKWIAKGDANNSEDKPIEQDDVLGKVIRIIPQIGTWRKVILSPEVLELIAILVVLLIIAYIYTSKTEGKND